MFKRYLLAVAGCTAYALSAAATAQFLPPPPGSAQGTESGTYGSAIGYDVRGTGSVDRFGRPYDPMNPTDTGSKPVDPREKTDAEKEREAAMGARRPADTRAILPGASMNPGLSPGAAPGGPPSMSPNLNPGRGTAAGGAPGAGTGTSGRAGAPASR